MLKPLWNWTPHSITYVYGNPLSYSVLAKNDLRIRLNRWKQNLVSTQMIRDFFRDRLPEVNAINEDHITRYLLHTIRDVTRLGDKSSLLEAMNELKSCGRNPTPKGDSSLRFFAQFSPSLCWFLKQVQCRLIDPSFIS